LNIIQGKEAIKSFYKDEELSGKYIEERFMKPLGRVQHQIQIEMINSMIRCYNIRNILEIACGPARLTRDIKWFSKGVGLDTSDQMLEIARQRVNEPERWQFINADAFDIKLRERFHLIYTFRFIRHFRRPERIKLYSEFNRLLNNKGILIFDAVHYEKIALFRKMENKHGKIVYDKIYKRSQELKEELENEGYEVIELRGVVNHFYPQAVISRISHKIKMDKIGIKLINLIERIPFGNPLEWIVICRKI